MATSPTPDLGELPGEIYEAWEESMTEWWDQVLESPAFLKNMGDNLSATTRARSAYEAQVDKGLEELHLPTRQDMLRVARIASLLEDRQLQLEDRLLAMSDKMAEMEKETLKARVEAAETRLLVEHKLVGIEAKLDQLLSKDAPAPRRRPTRKTTASKTKES